MIEFKKISGGRALYVQEKNIWIAKGHCFFSIDHSGRRTSKKYCVGKGIEKLLGTFRLSRQLLRVGIHHLIPLKDGGFLAALKKKTLILDSEGDIRNIFTGYKGNKPGHRGICITPEGDIFFGEYTLNTNRENETKLFRSIDNGQSFQAILTFSKNDVRHIHFVQWDDYEKCLWLGTGDLDHECRLMKSIDNGDTWEIVGEGSQLWRAVGVSFTKDSLYWGTDAGSVSDPNYIIKMDRKSCKLEKVLEVEGPCHGNAVLSNGTVYASTGVEGGENEKDRYARLYKINNDKADMILRKKKDIFPLILQYGVMRFPLGIESTDKTIFTTFGLSRSGEAVYIGYEKYNEQ